MIEALAAVSKSDQFARPRHVPDVPSCAVNEKLAAQIAYIITVVPIQRLWRPVADAAKTLKSEIALNGDVHPASYYQCWHIVF